MDFGRFRRTYPGLAFRKVRFYPELKRLIALFNVANLNCPQFAHIAVTQNVWIEVQFRGQVLHVLPVYIRVPAQFREDKIIRVRNAQPNVRETTGI